MAENEERKKFWHIFYSPLVFIILLAVFIFLARSVWKVYGHEQVSEQDRVRLEDKLSTVNQHTAVLKDQVNTLQTAQGIEDQIRSKFNVTKAGEGVAVIVNSVSTTSTTSASTTEESWWQKFMNVLRD